MKHLILHVGTHKTGTSSLQGFLNDNAHLLEKQGIGFPEAKSLSYLSSTRNAHFLYSLARVEAQRQNGKMPSALSDEDIQVANENKQFVTEYASSFNTVILSDERLWTSGARFEGFWQAAKQILSEMGFDKVEIVVYLRRQDIFISSLWNQSVKSAARQRKTLDEYAQDAGFMRAMDYDATLRILENEFGRENIKVRVYDREKLVDGDVRADFCQTVGIDVDSEFLFNDDYVNPGINNPDIIEIKRQVNFVKSYAEGDNFLLGPAANASSAAAARNASHMSSSLREEIFARYAEGNARIAREYLGWEDGMLFDTTKKIPEEWSYDSEAFAYSTIQFFTEALCKEHLAQKKAEQRLNKLEKQAERLENQTLKLEKQINKLLKNKEQPSAE